MGLELLPRPSQGVVVEPTIADCASHRKSRRERILCQISEVSPACQLGKDTSGPKSTPKLHFPPGRLPSRVSADLKLPCANIEIFEASLVVAVNIASSYPPHQDSTPFAESGKMASGNPPRGRYLFETRDLQTYAPTSDLRKPCSVRTTSSKFDDADLLNSHNVLEI